MRRHVRWRHVDDGSHEELVLESDTASVTAEGRIVGASGADVLRYRVGCDGTWRTRSVQAFGPHGSVSLAADGQGHWTAGDHAIPELQGCIDVDIQETPFTNTVAIKRLGLHEGQSRSIRVAYIPPPSLRPKAVEQTYTCLRLGRAYRYGGYPAGFTADLTVDSDGLVVAYPGLFERT